MGAIVKVSPNAPEGEVIARAAEVLRRGGLVAFPTETVYGLGASANSAAGEARLVAVKRRPPDKPFTLLAASAAQAEGYVTPSALFSRLARRFWPGPLTIVAPAREGRGNVGLRVPAHPVPLALVRELGCPIFAPSANRSGEPPCTDAQSVAEALGDEVDVILDGGPAPGGRASTVVLVAGEELRILRPGPISAEQLAELGARVVSPCEGEQ